MESCIEAVEAVFRILGEGSATTPGVLGFEVADGGFHLKAGTFGDYFAAKINGNFPGNPAGFGLPTIQGLIVLSSVRDGRPLAVLDSGELTARRTGAATGVAVKFLAPDQPLTVTLCGCGQQASAQLEAVAAVREIAAVFASDIDPAQAQRLTEAQSSMRITPISWSELARYTRQSDLVITCTPSRSGYLGARHVRPGALVAAVGADNPHKQELAHELMAAAHVVTDLTAQCAKIGDLHHALEAGVMRLEDVHAELGEVVAGRAAGFGSQTIVFDSTGHALQDVAAAAIVYERAIGHAQVDT